MNTPEQFQAWVMSLLPAFLQRHPRHHVLVVVFPPECFPGADGAPGKTGPFTATSLPDEATGDVLRALAASYPSARKFQVPPPAVKL